MSYSDISPIDVDGTVSSSIQGMLIGSLATMPTASADYDGITVQYTGATSGGYVHNAFYRCGSNGQGGYAWTKVTSGDDTAGSLTHPIYMNAGVPTPTTYELNAAGARGVDTAVTDGSSNLPTSDAVHDYVKDSTIAIKTSGGTTVGDFSLNQASNEDITLPASAIQASDVSVTFALQGSPDYADYPYRGQYAVTGITADDYAEVTFSPAQVASGYYAPFCVTTAGYVNMYASSNVGTVTVPTISIGNYESNPDHSDPAWNTKLGKIETAGLRAYTHNGAEQGDMPIDTAATANTLVARDVSGIGYAANPAGGAVDTSVVNANWVSQTGNSAPNNLVHRSGGSEEIKGVKKFITLIDGVSRRAIAPYANPFIAVTSTDWIRYFTMNPLATVIFTILGQSYGTICIGEFAIGGSSTNNRSALMMKSSNFNLSMISIFNTDDNVFEIWVKCPTTYNIQVSIDNFLGPYYPTTTFDGATTSPTEPAEDATHINKVVIV